MSRPKISAEIISARIDQETVDCLNDYMETMAVNKTQAISELICAGSQEQIVFTKKNTNFISTKAEEHGLSATQYVNHIIKVLRKSGLY